MPEAEVSIAEPPQQVPHVTGNLPELRAPMSAEQVVGALETAARRGRLPGFSPVSGGFRFRDFGAPFECELAATTTPLPSGGTSISFAIRIRPVPPWIFGIVLAVSIWPGIYLVDSMLKHYFSWYDFPTWWWYLPLTVPTSPWALMSALKKSRASGEAEARELISKVASELKVQVVGPG